MAQIVVTTAARKRHWASPGGVLTAHTSRPLQI